MCSIMLPAPKASAFIYPWVYVYNKIVLLLWGSVSDALSFLPGPSNIIGG